MAAQRKEDESRAALFQQCEKGLAQMGANESHHS